MDTSTPPAPGRARHALGSAGRHWVLTSLAVVLLVIAGSGLYVWHEVGPLLNPKYRVVDYSVPAAPHLTARDGETIYRIDPTRSTMTYGIDEKVVGQSAGRAEGSTSGIAGDVALNSTTPSASRVGEIVVDVEELHSDNSLRDARIRADFLRSHDFPLARLTGATITGLPASITPGTKYAFTMTGQLEVSGKRAPTTWEGTARIVDGRLTARASTDAKLSTFGIGPISLAGLVSTGDAVVLTLDLTAVDPSKVSVPTAITVPSGASRPGSGPSFKRRIQPVLEANCASCHNRGQVGAGHWALDTAADAAKVADGIGTVTKARYMPPWPASTVGVPLAHSKTLDQKTIDTIVAWSRAGGRLDVPASTAIRPTKGPTPDPPRRDVVLKMPQPYTGSAAVPNDYRCFVLDPHLATPTWITGYAVTADQRDEIHHAQVFHITASQAAEGLQRSGSDGKPGWSCYAGPSLRDTGSGTAVQPAGAAGAARRASISFSQPGLIAGWVPGQDPSTYPHGSGILFQPGDAIVFQVHYHYEKRPTPDRSSIALQTSPGTTALRPIEIVNPIGPVEIPCAPGTTGALCDRNAALKDDMRLYGPAGGLTELGLLAVCGKTQAALTAGFTGVASASCDTRVPETGTIVAAMGHMHTLGKSFRLTLDPDSPSSKVLLDIPTWNFDWQMNYTLAKPIHVVKGQTIRMSCTWDRSLDPNRPPKYIVFAEGTEDEMCFSTYALIPDATG
jgi:polyisoprenoid-binding protein YceI